MFLVWRVAVAFCATVVCFVPVGMAMAYFALSGHGRTFLSIAHHGIVVVGAFAIAEIGAWARDGGLRPQDRFSIGWVAVSTILGQMAGFALEPHPRAGALACGLVGGLAATLIWTRESRLDPETGSRRNGRYGFAILLAPTLVTVGRATGILTRL